MKTLFTLLAAGMFCFAATAQDNKMSTTKDHQAPMEKKMMVEKKYWCTQCDHSATKEGVCPTHHTTMVKEGMYFCNGDEAHAMMKPGKCKDGSAMTRMDETLVKKNKMTGEKMEKEKVEEHK